MEQSAFKPLEQLVRETLASVGNVEPTVRAARKKDSPTPSPHASHSVRFTTPLHSMIILVQSWS